MKKKETIKAEIIESSSKAIQANNVTSGNVTAQNILNTLVSEIPSISTISNFDISRKNNKTTVKVDSEDGSSRTIVTFEKQRNFTQTTVTNSSKGTIQERRELVGNLRKEGKSQSEIASMTMVSQRTIANDLKIINSKKS
ncbi:hypothetical protein [Aliarcobacter butzleri]|uniref:hypothetical protein n=1 Tax=Aliarcobacter butzleri TaxID=28197 RepID=UPI001EDD1EDA|nr:hypothetical protein [Aliarcobacter butzleri]MCG3695465.1 hypothetical protein [Aliarcobacter butzleri]